MPVEITDSTEIAGVQIANLRTFSDERGAFRETFRRSWFPQRSWDKMQVNRSQSKQGVLRGLHYHYHQVDFWTVMAGELRAVLLDLRPNSPTFKAAQMVPIGDSHPVGLFIPVGVAHGFVAVTDVLLAYVVDNYYDSSDEHGIAWNDPLAFDYWGVTEPLVSERDANNPGFDQIPMSALEAFR